MSAYEEIYLIRNFYPSRARNYATTIISKLNNFAEVLAVRVHVDVYMATPALRSLTHETLCDTGQRTADSGQRTADTLKFTNHHLPTTKYHHFKPSILAFFAASPQKIIDGKNKPKFQNVCTQTLGTPRTFINTNLQMVDHNIHNSSVRYIFRCILDIVFLPGLQTQLPS